MARVENNQVVELVFKPENFRRDKKFAFRGKEFRMTLNFSAATMDARRE